LATVSVTPVEVSSQLKALMSEVRYPGTIIIIDSELIRY